MFLAIDIGNSHTKFGKVESGRVTATHTIPTDVYQGPNEIHSRISEFLRDTNGPDALIVSSVVRESDDIYTRLAEDILDAKAIFIDHNFDFGFEIEYFPREDCGIDRLAAAAALIEEPGPPFIACDFGTATTIDVVNSESKYLGGIIVPGPGTFADGLFRHTSRLPTVEIARPRSVIGNSTKNAIRSGIYFGYVGLVDGLIERMNREFGGEPPVIATGGYAGLIAESSRYVNSVDPQLVLNGIARLYLLNRERIEGS